MSTNREGLIPHPTEGRVSLVAANPDACRDALEVDVESFIGVKSYKAKGKRLTTLAVERIEELEPLRRPDAPDAADPDSGTPVPDAADDAPAPDDTPAADETGQTTLPFTD